jgi:hypothetical protein
MSLAAPDAAIHEHLDASVDRGDELGQGAEARRYAVELPPAMVRDNHRVGARVNRMPRIVAVCTPLTTIGPCHASRIQRRSCQVTRVFSRSSTDVAARHGADARQLDVRKDRSARRRRDSR